MKTTRHAPPLVLDFLGRTDTCTVSNAIETFNVRMRNEGYIQGRIRSMFPDLPPSAGYAVTGRIRTGAPPIAHHYYYQNIEWWEFVASLPGPKIVVLADVDSAPGTGAFFGEIHMRISKALGCVAYVTNGTIRDLPEMKAAGFPCFAEGVSVSHAYAHLIEMNEPVEIGCLQIRTGDLLHADCHGVQKIPLEIAPEIPGAVARIAARERELIGLCTDPAFSIEKLKALLQRGGDHVERNSPARV
ncbi:MAG TPA: RraA family protein [Bryobacteraceae bacterium]|nr:RraA family protein [Bryobacteraceae bacterium]